MNQPKRASERLLANIPVRWEGLSGTLGARTEDISVGGCFVNTLGIAIPGDSMMLELCLPSGEWLAVNGQVTSYLQGMGFGVKFTFENVEEEIVMRRLLTSLTIGQLASESSHLLEPNLRA
jgi:hypothetical protein